MTTTKFINFGCWNKYGCSLESGIKKVVEELLKQTNVKFSIVNGDNYYQEKTKGDEESVKKVNEMDLLRGMKCLNQWTDNEIYLLMGNHDLEITDGKCETMSFERAFVEGVNSQAKREKIIIPTNLTMFKTFQETLIIMMDTNIYADEDTYCYRKLLDEINDEQSNNNEQLQKLKNKQRNTIENYLTKGSNKHYRNIIVCGHHPLIGFKNQQMKKDKLKNKVKIKGGIDAYNVELYQLLSEVIRPHGEQFFYLCADIHNYQKGTVTINQHKGQIESIMTIQQYVVGTGGADLDDDYNEKYSPNYCLTESPLNTPPVTMANIDITPELSLTYQVLEHWSNYGFIVVEIDPSDNIVVTPVQIGKSVNSGGRLFSKRKKYYLFNNKKTRKNKKN